MIYHAILNHIKTKEQINVTLRDRVWKKQEIVILVAEDQEHKWLVKFIRAHPQKFKQLIFEVTFMTHLGIKILFVKPSSVHHHKTHRPYFYVKEVDNLEYMKHMGKL